MIDWTELQKPPAIKPGDTVTVDTGEEGRVRGIVMYIAPDGYLAVNLHGEGNRVDEWPPRLVRPVEN